MLLGDIMERINGIEDSFFICVRESHSTIFMESKVEWNSHFLHS